MGGGLMSQDATAHDVRPLLKSDALKALEAYWRSKRRGDALPRRRDIDPWEMRAFLSHVFLIAVTQNPMRFWFRSVGGSVSENFGENVTGKYVDELDLDEMQKQIVADYKTAAIEARPVYSRCEWIKGDDQRHLRYERLLLPLSSDGKTVDTLLGGAMPIDSIE
jgi:hypothetical protein